ncbi:putative ABC transporter permease protein YclO [Ignatzschineria indica]|uniref:iron chelate uptake ABC transporter family permease subunit n=1 Tax=Ignatzschineria indica TaxID=472583 RepID=UPI0019CF49B0|nr:iron chelate uptake ABC transporter family permease subunit [Ignatzschineria indica]GGZ73804.1 putative ABC transporter permease protein YclO [Ignatzschineria indica]
MNIRVINTRMKLVLLLILAVASSALFLFYQLGVNWDYVLPRRSYKLLAMVIAGSAIAFSTVIFQTVTHNRILTPSIIGLDSLYLLVQTLLVYFLGGKNFAMISNEWLFLLSVLVLVTFSMLLFKMLLGKDGRSVFFLLLIGIVLGALFQSLSTFMQVLIDPNEFFLVQDKMFASFNNVQVKLIWWALGIIGVTMILYLPMIKYLDVLSLGRDQSVNLGISYRKVVMLTLIVVSVLTAVSTALIGPITFLGLLVANLGYEIFKTYRHSVLLMGTILVSIIALAFGQMLVERVFSFSTTLSVIINFIGGLYFIYLLLRGSK